MGKLEEEEQKAVKEKNMFSECNSKKQRNSVD